MRIVFINLHGNEMLMKTMDKYIFNHSCAIKHNYFLNYLLDNPDVEVCTFLNDRGFSLMHYGNESIVNALNIFKYAEFKKCLKKNSIDARKITVLKSISEIRPDDIVVAYRHHIEQLRGLEDVEAFKVVSMIHFWGRKDEAAEFKKAKLDCLMSESNLQENSEIFRRYYDFDGSWVVHPFVYGERFKNMKPFSERKTMCFSTGTVTYRDIPDFVDVYGDPCDQPLRKQIMTHKEELKGFVDCYNSDYNEDSSLKVVNDSDNELVSLYKKFYNKTHVGQQKKYYSFDMVEKFNEYKMCLVGEEVLGIPGIGYVEGMACGCAYIGLDSKMYTDVGLIPGVHYITYDGSIEDLKRVIKYYQMDEHQEELEKIAKAGCEYVRENFRGPVVAEKLLNNLIEKQKEWKENK